MGGQPEPGGQLCWEVKALPRAEPDDPAAAARAARLAAARAGSRCEASPG